MSDNTTLVWTVSCECGYEESFLSEDDARDVYDAHSGRLCGSKSIEAQWCYKYGEGVDPEKTLPSTASYNIVYEGSTRP